MALGQSVLVRATPALLVAALVYGVAVDKAYTIDDSWFLLQAQQILKAPWQPFAYELAWDYKVGRAAELSPSGVGMSYLLVPVVAAGAPEWLAHLVVVLLLMMTCVLMVQVAVHLGLNDHEAMIAALLLVTMPTLLGMSATVMPDVAALAFGLLGIERVLAYRKGRRSRDGILAAVAVIVAALCRPHAILLVGVFAALAFDDGWPESWRRLRWRRQWPVAAAILVFALLIWATRDPLTASTNLEAIPRLAGFKKIPKNLVAFFAHWVLALPLTLSYLAVRWRSVAWRIGVGALVVALLCLWQAGRLQWWYAAVFAALSVVVLADIISEGVRRHDPLQLTLAIWLCLPLFISPYVHLPPKYLLISAPAVALMIVRVGQELSAGWRRLLGTSTAVLGLVLGLAIVRADTLLADGGRLAATELIAPRVARGETVWYFGHWGFQWYAEQAGARPILPRPPFAAPGDVIVGSGGERHPWLKRYVRQSAQTLAAKSGAVGSIMGGRLGAGFYSDHWGYLPWSWGAAPLPSYVVWQVIGP
jgi:hypothetical protein